MIIGFNCQPKLNTNKAMIYAAVRWEYFTRRLCGKSGDFIKAEAAKRAYEACGGWYEDISDFLARMKRELGVKELKKYIKYPVI